MTSIYLAIMCFLNRDDEDGQGLAEYALILALIAIVAIIALIFLGGQVSTILEQRRQLGLDRFSDRSRPPVPSGPAVRRFPDATLFGPDGLTPRAGHRYLDDPPTVSAEISTERRCHTI